MAVVCPTITAYDDYEYNEQIKRVRDFADRLHIDLMDGEFAPVASTKLEHVWWPHDLTADIHLMYKKPMDYIKQLIHLKPNMVIIHNEAEVHHMDFAAKLHKEGIKVGLAILQDTPADYAFQIMHSFDQVLIFSGHLGYHGGEADLKLLDKVKAVREHHPSVEIAWDGGINDENAAALVDAGVDVLNVGSYVQRSEDPLSAYAKIKSLSVSKYATRKK